MNFAWIGPWRARWSALGARERRVLAALAALLGAVFFYVLVWSPVQSGLAGAHARLAAAQVQLAQVREQAALVAKVRNAPSVAPPATPAAAVEQAAEKHGLRGQLKRVEAEGAGRVRVQLEGVSFSALTAWLAELQQQSGLRAESATLERHATPGAVNARLLLRSQGT